MRSRSSLCLVFALAQGQQQWNNCAMNNCNMNQCQTQCSPCPPCQEVRRTTEYCPTCPPEPKCEPCPPPPGKPAPTYVEVLKYIPVVDVETAAGRAQCCVRYAGHDQCWEDPSQVPANLDPDAVFTQCDLDDMGQPNNCKECTEQGACWFCPTLPEKRWCDPATGFWKSKLRTCNSPSCERTLGKDPHNCQQPVIKKIHLDVKEIVKTEVIIEVEDKPHQIIHVPVPRIETVPVQTTKQYHKTIEETHDRVQPGQVWTAQAPCVQQTACVAQTTCGCCC